MPPLLSVNRACLASRRHRDQYICCCYVSSESGRIFSSRTSISAGFNLLRIFPGARRQRVLPRAHRRVSSLSRRHRNRMLRGQRGGALFGAVDRSLRNSPCFSDLFRWPEVSLECHIARRSDNDRRLAVTDLAPHSSRSLHVAPTRIPMHARPPRSSTEHTSKKAL